MMKQLVPLLLILAGCQSRPTVPSPAPEPRAVSAPAPSGPSQAEWEKRLRRERQLAEALLSQNDALQAELREARTPPPAQPASKIEPSAPTLIPAAPPALPVSVEPAGPFFSPNADGLVDLTVPELPKAGEPVNPFAVRTPPADAREITLNLQGIITGAKPCALVNGRLVSVGDSVEGLQLIHIGPEALFFKSADTTLKLPLNFKTVRVRRS